VTVVCQRIATECFQREARCDARLRNSGPVWLCTRRAATGFGRRCPPFRRPAAMARSFDQSAPDRWTQPPIFPAGYGESVACGTARPSVPVDLPGSPDQRPLVIE
jgi:hypothetical protein